MGQKVISILGAVECVDCHVPMELHTLTATKLTLDKNGRVVGRVTDEYDAFLKCPECGEEHEYVRYGYNYALYSELQERLDVYNVIERLDKENIKSPFVKGD